jgi:hypothetical protein
MKMADGGFRPAYNTQFAADCESQMIVVVEVVSTGSDMGQLVLMLEQVEHRLGQAPAQWLIDGGFPVHEQLAFVLGATGFVPMPNNWFNMVCSWMLLAWFFAAMALIIGSLSAPSEIVERV